MRYRSILLAMAFVLPAGVLAQQTAPAPDAPDGGVVPLPPVTLPLKLAPRPTTAAITAADLMTRLYIFADDSMQGREAGSIGNVKGTDYIASEAAKMGLTPAGENGTFFQTIPLKERQFDDSSTFAVNGTRLTAFTDYLPTARAPYRRAGIPIVYGGELGDSLHTITAAQAAGRLVVFTVAADANALRARRSEPEAAREAAAIAVVVPRIDPRFVGFLRRPQMFVDDPANAPAAAQPSFLLTAAAAATMFPGALEGLAPGTAGATADIDLRYHVQPIAYPARNVVAIIPGSDAKLRAQYVAIGAHNDHIGMTRAPVDHDSLRIWNHRVRPEGADDGGKQATPAQQSVVDSVLAAFRAAHPGADRPDSIDNGADDDGSGTVTVLEIAQRIAAMKVKPKRSILFVWHTGEEKGLLGSRFFTDHPTVPRDSIVAQLNMDMVGRGDAWDETGRTKEGAPIHGSPTYLQLVGSRRLSTELGDIVEQVNRADGHHLTLDYSIDANGHPANIYCRSDHYSYARYGIPIVFFTTGLHSDYHQVTDEPEYIDYEHMARVANFVEDIAVHVADLDHRVVVDHPRPDPRGACRQ